VVRPPGGDRASLTAITRILVVSDIGGNETVWRKFVNTISLDVYKVDAALLAGGLGVDAERAQAWIELAAERLADVSIPLCLIPGAADDPAIDIELTAVERNPVNVDGRAYPLPGGLTLISDSCRPGSPPIAERLAALAADAGGPLVLMTAAPPYDPATASGSREVAKAIDRLRPGLSLHGCSGVGDETPDPKRFIGDTLALTPGSEADRDGLLGFVVDLVGAGVRLARPFQT
jgi:Icc-related predicted phosphoesterase